MHYTGKYAELILHNVVAKVTESLQNKEIAIGVFSDIEGEFNSAQRNGACRSEIVRSGCFNRRYWQTAFYHSSTGRAQHNSNLVQRGRTLEGLTPPAILGEKLYYSIEVLRHRARQIIFLEFTFERVQNVTMDLPQTLSEKLMIIPQNDILAIRDSSKTRHNLRSCYLVEEGSTGSGARKILCTSESCQSGYYWKLVLKILRDLTFLHVLMERRYLHRMGINRECECCR
ncbi:hypothetical protein Trydic_g8860 [Trypoxylus dichotomus]